MTQGPGPPLIGLPAPVNRRTRVGPFPSAGAALKFVTIAAGGAILALFAGPWSWLPFLGGGFLLTTGRRDGKTLEEKAGDFLRWQARRRGRSRSLRRPARAPSDARVARLDSGRLVAVLLSGGVPVAFLPPDEARALFEGYREFVRSVDSGFVLRVESRALDPTPHLPTQTARSVPSERPAREGYVEMVRLLCRRRRVRRVHVVLWAARGEDRAALLDRVGSVEERLRALGLDVEGLAGDSLTRTLTQFGWSVGALS